MNVVIRTDASTLIGSGHVMRCLTLANQLRQNGAAVSFVCRELPGNCCSAIRDRGFDVALLRAPEGVGISSSDANRWLGVEWQTDADQTIEHITPLSRDVDWLIVDHYALDSRWETSLRPHVGQILVIDDLADRKHQCDMLLDQNYYEETSSRYNGLTPATCRRLVGPRYALLRPEFIEGRRSRGRRTGEIHRLLIFFGGVDRTNETSKAVDAVTFAAEQGIAVDVVVGAANPHFAEIEEKIVHLQSGRLLRNVGNMAELMSEADLAIGAGGTTTLERAYLGLPSITIVIADNQAESIRALDELGAVWNLGNAGQVTTEDIRRAVRFALVNPHSVKLAGDRARLIFGHSEYGGTKEVVRTILEATHVTA
jgi:UDP-2,4-diacetamido-2,4,6-trideoxy-beta-L-altropyranose hydrolase